MNPGGLFRYIVAAALAAGMLATALPAAAVVNVVTTTPELEAIAREVGGSKVSVYSIARPNQDYHRVEARPSDVARVSKAQVFVRIGMDLDMWADSLLASARNAKVSKGGSGYVDASKGVKAIEVPTGSISGASGDIHAMGNPHYYYDPGYGKVIAYNVLLALRKVSPGDAAAFDANYSRFTGAIDGAMARWRQQLAPCKGKPVVTYHKNFCYFMQRFGIEEFGNLEPKPGLPPSAGHLAQLIQRMKRENVKALVVETVYGRRYPEFVARETGGRLEWVPYSIGVSGTRSYIDLIDKLVEGFRNACR